MKRAFGVVLFFTVLIISTSVLAESGGKDTQKPQQGQTTPAPMGQGMMGTMSMEQMSPMMQQMMPMMQMCQTMMKQMTMGQNMINLEMLDIMKETLRSQLIMTTQLPIQSKEATVKEITRLIERIDRYILFTTQMMGGQTMQPAENPAAPK